MMNNNEEGWKFEWYYCHRCKAPFIECPKCHNNCCNGGYKEVDGKECDVCVLAYEYQKNNYPPYDLFKKEMNNMMINLDNQMVVPVFSEKENDEETFKCALKKVEKMFPEKEINNTFEEGISIHKGVFYNAVCLFTKK